MHLIWAFSSSQSTICPNGIWLWAQITQVWEMFLKREYIRCIQKLSVDWAMDILTLLIKSWHPFLLSMENGIPGVVYQLSAFIWYLLLPPPGHPVSVEEAITKWIIIYSISTYVFYKPMMCSTINSNYRDTHSFT